MWSQSYSVDKQQRHFNKVTIAKKSIYLFRKLSADSLTLFIVVEIAEATEEKKIVRRKEEKYISFFLFGFLLVQASRVESEVRLQMNAVRGAKTCMKMEKFLSLRVNNVNFAVRRCCSCWLRRRTSTFGSTTEQWH